MSLKKKLKKLKKKVKALQKFNCYIESKLDKLELDINLLRANKADCDEMFDDIASHQHDLAIQQMVGDLSDEELNEVFKEHNSDEASD